MIALWIKVSTAASLELAALSMLTNTPTVAYLAGYFALHAMASTVVAFLAWALLPAQYKHPVMRFTRCCGRLHFLFLRWASRPCWWWCRFPGAFREFCATSAM